GYIIQCFFVLVFFFVILQALDLWTKKKLGPLPAPKILRFLQEGFPRIKRAALWPVLGKVLLGLGLAFHLVYVLIFIKNWDDRALAQSYFSAIVKVGRSPQVLLHRPGQPSTARGKMDKKFIDIFEWTVPFELRPGQQRKSIRLGPAFFFDRCPPGCYKVDLEFYDPPPDLSLLSLDFMRETREMTVIPLPGKAIISTIYLVFQDMFVSPEFVMRYEARLARAVKGRMIFFPIPSLVFENKLMVRLAEGLYPSCIRSSGPHTYLGFMANARKDNSTFRFHLSLRESPEGGGGATEIPLGTYPVKFWNRGRHKFDIRLDQPGRAWPEEGTVVFSVSDARGRPMDCRSVWLTVGEKSWFIRFPP
ncbi:MAG: hypothetical protein WCB96_03740, partial [Candidatus Aminicenantales bacterium]